MIKEKFARGDEPWESAAQRLRGCFPDWSVDDTDGLRFSRGDEWVHVRASGTEPVVRVIGESLSDDRTRAILDRARAAVEPAARGSV